MRPRPDSPEEVVHLALEGLFPSTQILAIHLTLRILSRLGHDQRHPLILGEQQFSRGEFNLLYPLLMNYPAYTGYEVLYASFNYGGYACLSDRAIARARAYLESCRELGSWTVATHPITATLSRARSGLHALGLDHVLLMGIGYTLDQYRQW